MTRWVVLLLLFAGVVAEAQVSTPSQTFSFYKCSCTATTTGTALTSQSVFGAVPQQPWAGSVYASNSQDAAFKAQNACMAESHGNFFACVQCRCAQ